jgi:hypothetical protein
LLSYGNHSSPFVANTLGSGHWSAGDPFANLMIDEAYWSSTTYGEVLDDALRVNFDEVCWTGPTKMNSNMSGQSVIYANSRLSS